jgi:bacterioferritin
MRADGLGASFPVRPEIASLGSPEPPRRGGRIPTNEIVTARGTHMAKDSRGDLIKELNVDLSREYSAIIQDRTSASAVTGPYRLELRQFFANEITDELGHARLLADKVVAMGGKPVVQAAGVKYTEDPEEMVQTSLADEQLTIRRYVERQEQTEACGECGPAVDLDDLIADESRHRDELRLMLTRWK